MSCASGICMSAVTLAIILVDIYHNEYTYLIHHLLLGGILSILFFVMCNYGLELINWVFLGIIPVYMFVSWLFSHTSRRLDEVEEEEGCNVCKKPVLDCECSLHEKRPADKKIPLTCPAKPGMRLETECGLSRFT